jgi:hypothetical protein
LERVILEVFSKLVGKVGMVEFFHKGFELLVVDLFRLVVLFGDLLKIKIDFWLVE